MMTSGAHVYSTSCFVVLFVEQWFSSGAVDFSLKCFSDGSLLIQNPEHISKH